MPQNELRYKQGSPYHPTWYDISNPYRFLDQPLLGGTYQVVGLLLGTPLESGETI